MGQWRSSSGSSSCCRIALHCLTWVYAVTKRNGGRGGGGGEGQGRGRDDQPALLNSLVAESRWRAKYRSKVAWTCVTRRDLTTFFSQSVFLQIILGLSIEVLLANIRQPWKREPVPPLASRSDAMVVKFACDQTDVTPTQTALYKTALISNNNENLQSAYTKRKAAMKLHSNQKP